MENLGSGGEAKASPADRDDTMPIGPVDEQEVDQTERGSTMDTALDESDEGIEGAHIGYGETAAYGETAENAPAPTES